MLAQNSRFFDSPTGIDRLKGHRQLSRSFQPILRGIQRRIVYGIVTIRKLYCRGGVSAGQFHQGRPTRLTTYLALRKYGTDVRDSPQRGNIGIAPGGTSKQMLTSLDDVDDREAVIVIGRHRLTIWSDAFQFEGDSFSAAVLEHGIQLLAHGGVFQNVGPAESECRVG